MAGRFSDGRLADPLAGVAIVGSAAIAHAAAGGDLGGVDSFMAILVVVAAVTVLTARLRWTFTRLVIAAGAVQPLLHLVLIDVGGHGAHSMHHAAGQHSTAMSSDQGSGLAMWIAHIAVALAAAVVLRWGVQWLRSMPDLVKAIVFAVHRSAAPVALLTVRASQTIDACPRRAALMTWDSRGPPGSL